MSAIAPLLGDKRTPTVICADCFRFSRPFWRRQDAAGYSCLAQAEDRPPAQARIG